MDRFVEVEESDGLVSVGSKAPDFELQAHNLTKWRLSDFRGKVVALLFYPGNETLVCTKQLCSLRDRWTEYKETKAEIVGISPGSVEEHVSFADHHRLPLTLLSDPNRNVTRDYGFHWLLPISWVRSIVVIDSNGIVRSRTSMFRGFRPSDSSVLSSIYAARTELLVKKYDEIAKAGRKDGEDE
ncbi:MAG: peroxiredoxin family protein [Pyrinomonadaceae bacterium]